MIVVPLEIAKEADGSEFLKDARRVGERGVDVVRDDKDDLIGAKRGTRADSGVVDDCILSILSFQMYCFLLL